MSRSTVVVVRCNACGGTYTPVQADGMQYFHVCPPVEAVRVQQADGAIVIVPKRTRRVDTTDEKTGATITTIEYELPAGVTGTVIGDVALERGGARNENPHPTDRDRAGKAPMIAEGAGVTPIAAAPVEIVGFDEPVRTRTP